MTDAPRGTQHQVPTHLGVEDTLLLGLTGQQVARLIAGGSLAYALWDGDAGTAVPLRAGLVALCLLATLAFALVRPWRRPLEEWGFVAARYASLPRQAVWRVVPAEPPCPRTSDGDWADPSPYMLAPPEADR